VRGDGGQRRPPTDLVRGLGDELVLALAGLVEEMHDAVSGDHREATVVRRERDRSDLVDALLGRHHGE
jgi:hypothetical protein